MSDTSVGTKVTTINNKRSYPNQGHYERERRQASCISIKYYTAQLEVMGIHAPRPDVGCPGRPPNGITVAEGLARRKLEGIVC